MLGILDNRVPLFSLMEYVKIIKDKQRYDGGKTCEDNYSGGRKSR